MMIQNKAKPRDPRTRGASNHRTPRSPGRSVDVRSIVEEPAEVSVSTIRWITDRELALAGDNLRRLKRIGRQLEKRGDYFGSGNLAYQLRQIAADIQTLVRGSSRVQRRN
jgi:hypothetical protein